MRPYTDTSPMYCIVAGVGSRARLNVILTNLSPSVFVSIHQVVRRKAIILEAVEATCAAAAGGHAEVVKELLQR